MSELQGLNLIRTCLLFADVSQTPSWAAPALASCPGSGTTSFTFSWSLSSSIRTGDTLSVPNLKALSFQFLHRFKKKKKEMYILLSSLQIYITCYLEAVPLSKKDPEKKACSFITGRSVSVWEDGRSWKIYVMQNTFGFAFRWRSADGDDHACESCDRPGEAAEGSSAYFIHERAQRSNRGRGLNGVMCAGFPPGSQCAGHVNSRP